ncbi:helix-turn-helix domain-containing protein [uncultured Psychroserpens sp.]|uniref:helix-turn-helix domain-containing protein n=1 Tax=uncultured Psychroserpens sp. TaxID=255436 RepID=UPI00262ED133|nr:helix-turn-helix domain-containing protein [uncultured Psychroserpens sp.]
MDKLYEEYKLNYELNKYVDCVWKEQHSNSISNHNKDFLIVPDNTVELVFTSNTMYRKSSDTEKIVKIKSHLSGLKTKAQNINVTGNILLSVRIKPYSLYKFTKQNLKHTIDQSILIQDVFGTDISILEHRLFEAQNETQQLQLIQTFLMKRLSRINKNDMVFDYTIQEILKTKGQINFKDLAFKTNTSLKTIERKFITNLGLTPKKYCRIIRLFHTLKITNNHINTKLSSIGFDNGFYDQTHLYKEIKQFTSMKPKDFFKSDRRFQIPIFSS